MLAVTPDKTSSAYYLEALAPYSRYVEDGTGVYGPKKKPIVANEIPYSRLGDWNRRRFKAGKQRLFVFKIGGKQIFAKKIVGSKPKNIMRDTAKIVASNLKI